MGKTRVATSRGQKLSKAMIVVESLFRGKTSPSLSSPMRMTMVGEMKKDKLRIGTKIMVMRNHIM